MRVDELFHTPVADYELDEITPAEAARQYGVVAVAAYAFYIDGEPYVVYFSPGERYNSTKDDMIAQRGWYNCSFAKIKMRASGHPDYNLTNLRMPFKVFRCVLEGIRRFIASHRPVTITCEGYMKRQGEFYRRLAATYNDKLPKPYFWAMDMNRVLITRSRTVVPEQDYLDRVKAAEQPVAEGAVEDFTANQRATVIANTFLSWLSLKNADVPLADVLHSYSHSYNHDRILYATGAEIGLKDCDDLFIGFAWNPTKAYHGEPYGATKGYHTPARNTATGQIAYFVVLTRDRDPSQETDIAFSVNTEFLVHEITHYFDRKRQSPTARYGGEDSKNPAKYVNSPFEFNAFFQQGVHHVLKGLNRRAAKDELATFDSFLKNNLFQFDEGFRANLTPETKRRLTKRLYRLWVLIKDHYPNVHLIGREAEAIAD